MNNGKDALERIKKEEQIGKKLIEDTKKESLLIIAQAQKKLQELEITMKKELEKFEKDVSHKIENEIEKETENIRENFEIEKKEILKKFKKNKNNIVKKIIGDLIKNEH